MLTAPTTNVGITHRVDTDSPKDVVIAQVSSIANSTKIDIARVSSIGLIMPSNVQSATAIRIYVSNQPETGYVPLQAEEDDAAVFEEYAIAADIAVTLRAHKHFPFLYMKLCRTTNGTSFTATATIKS